MAEFGDLLSELRKDHKLTQEELANILFVSSGTISNYENNVHYPDVVKLKQLAEYFDVTTDYLLGQSEERTPASMPRVVSDEEIKFALFGGDGEITDAMYDEVKQFAAFIKQREAGKKE